MKTVIISLFSGALFAAGLGISGMTDANKVIGFLNLAGDWDPTLAFVMIGGIGVHLVFFRLIMKREAPIAAGGFFLPTVKDVDFRLVVGSALFGVGWGLGGFCPGPGVVSSVTGKTEVLIFVAAMVAGIILYGLVDAKLTSRFSQGERP
jgi:uncharacterized protein